MKTLSPGVMYVQVAALSFLLSGISLGAVSAEFPILSVECESALARSAAPENIANGASVYVLTRRGYVLAEKGSNDFSCIVARDSDRSIQPVCYDKFGADSILQTIVDTGPQLLNYVAWEEIYQLVEEGLKTGRYKYPTSTSLSYMLSDFNLYWRENRQEMKKARPHYMISTVHTRESILFDEDLSKQYNSLPTIAPMGPFRYFIVTSENATDSANVLESCGSQLDRYTALIGERKP